MNNRMNKSVQQKKREELEKLITKLTIIIIL